MYRHNEQINGEVRRALTPRCKLQTGMRERVLAFVRAIVKSTHLNMNKSRAVGSLVRLSVHSLIRMSVRPFVHPARCNGGGDDDSAYPLAPSDSAECFTHAHLWIA